MNIKKLIADSIGLKIENINFEDLISLVQDSSMGDYCIPCFSLAKIMRKSPVAIAEEIKNSINNQELIEKMQVVNGYLNIYLNKKFITLNVLNQAYNNKDFYSDNQYEGKILAIDYSSVNIAKYMHIGHLSTTMIGESIARIYEAKGYKIKRINYIGDFGTPFGMMTYAYLNWGNEKELEERGIDYLQELYVDFNKRLEDDKNLEEDARVYFKLIEDKDPKIYPIYERFIEISKKEAKAILDELGVTFDSWKGESAYTALMPETIKELTDKKLLIESEGAKVVDLNEYNLGYAVIQKSNGSSLYITRDITAAIDRKKEHNFDKMFYVTAVQQKFHFEQLFKVLDLMGYEFSKNMEHIYYGMFSLPTGKIASRKGKQAVLRDLMDYAYNKSYSIVENRQFNIENKESVAKKIAMSALKFNALKNERIKDTVFDVENAFSFDGDTSAYIQYCYARVCSILRKANINNFKNIDVNYLTNENTYNLVLALNLYKDKLNLAFNSNEPSVISKYTIDLCKLFNKFYSNEKVITENTQETQAKVYLLTIFKNTLANLFNLICVDTIEEM